MKFRTLILLLVGTVISPLVWGVDLGELKEIPQGRGLPVLVRTAVYYYEVKNVDDNAGTFEATVDLRLIWQDNRLKYPATEGIGGMKEFLFSKATDQVAQMWTPRIKYTNRVGDPTQMEQRVRLFPDGTVEWLTRTTATYSNAYDVSKFPFDHQSLNVEISVEEDTVERVLLNYTSDDVEFSRARKEGSLAGWNNGLVRLDQQNTVGWDNIQFSKIISGLEIFRDPSSMIAIIFIPLFASLFIPFLAIWMNRVEGGGFNVEGFELANVIIGGLFAVIALAFTLGSSYPAVAASDNTVTRLLGLNYASLGFTLLIVVALYRFNLVKQFWGQYVQEQVFLFISWAFPVVVAGTGVAFIVGALQ